MYKAKYRANVFQTVTFGDRKIVAHIDRAECPFEKNFKYRLTSDVIAARGFENLIWCFCAVKDRVWLEHHVPAKLQMTGHDFFKQLYNPAVLGAQGFEVLIRMMRQEESKWYDPKYMARWRHVLLPWWAALVLSGGSLYMDRPDVKQLFIGADLGYDVETCTMIYAPMVDDEGLMVLYGFDVANEIVHIMDPVQSALGLPAHQAHHSQIAKALCQGLENCINAFFDGWSIKSNNFSQVFHRSLNVPCSSAESPFHVVHYILTFNGKNMTSPTNKAQVRYMKEQLLQLCS